MISYLSIKHLAILAVLGQCQLNDHIKSPIIPTSWIKADTIMIGASLTLDILAALVAHIEVENLLFVNKCKVLDIDKYKPLPKVNYNTLNWVIILSIG